VTRASRVAVILGIAAVAAILPAAPALARGGLLRGFDEDFYRYSDAAVRDTWFERTLDTGARIVRIPVSWRFVTTRQPVAPSNPADPAYDFGLVDAIVSDARAKGLRVMIQVLQAPQWAEGAGAPAGVEPGTWKPDPEAFRSFAEALGRRYSGQFVGPSGPLPEVEYFEVWNEPNLSRFLTPQWEGTRPESAIHYRRLLNAFYDGVKVAHPGAQVVAGATAPYGDPGHPRTGRMRPLRFLREVLCLKRHGAAECPTPPRLDVLSHHPISLSGGPKQSAIHRDDAATADFEDVVDLLRRAERAGTVLPAGRGRAAWATEFWWLSDPPGRGPAVPLKVHARWMQVSLFELWKQGADAAIYYQLIDKPPSTAGESATGLYFADGRQKPALRAFRFPFITEPAGRNRRRVWTIPPATGELTIEARGDRGWRTVKAVQVTEGVPERTTVRIGRGKSRAVIAGEASLIWHPGA
jgi:hypothetical protein